MNTKPLTSSRPSFVRDDNTLARTYASHTSSDRVDVIMTNPPFGGMEEDGTEKNFPAIYRTTNTSPNEPYAPQQVLPGCGCLR